MKKKPAQEHYLNSYFRNKSSSKTQIIRQYQGFLDRQRINRQIMKQESPLQQQKNYQNINKTTLESYENQISTQIQYETGTLSPIEKMSISPNEYASNQRDRQSNKQQKSYMNSILKSNNRNKKLAHKVTIKSRSPSRDRQRLSENKLPEKQPEQHPPLFPHQNIMKSVSSVNIFTESTKQLEELQHNQTYRQAKPELHKGIVDILSLIKKEKQVIMNDMKHITKQMHKYKNQYDELQSELSEIKNENMQLSETQDENESYNETYAKMIHILGTMDIDYRQVLPDINIQNFSQDDFKRNPIEKDEVIKLQKQSLYFKIRAIIKKQVKIIEDSRLLNQMLLNKIKES